MQPNSRSPFDVDFSAGGLIELMRQMGRGIQGVVPTAMIDRKVMRTLNLWVGVGFFLVLNGCAGPMNDRMGKTMYTMWTAEYAAAAYENISPDDLDNFIFKMKAIKDYEYGNYVTNLRRGTSWGEFGSDSVKIILDSLVAVTGSEGTKAALGAASAGLTGATSSIKKNVLFDQSITTFITKMDTLRLTKWNEILCKMGRGPALCRQTPHYTGAEAFGDLQEYGRCGTLDAALRAVDSKTSAEKVEAEKINKAINKIPKLEDGF
jgi:hypothetical protein